MSRTLGALVLASVPGLFWQTTAGTVYWNFDTEAPTSNGVANVAAGPVSRANGGTVALLSDESTSNGYAGTSGGSNAVAAAATGMVSHASTWFQFSLTPDTGSVLRLTRFSFGVRSTLTGPQAFSIRSSLDDYTAELAGGTVLPDSKWALKGAAPLFQTTVPGEPVTFRIYGYSGTLKKADNWRIDDLSLEAAAVPWFPPGSVISLK